MSNCRVIDLTNQTGGGGRTITAVNLGVSLAQKGRGHKVLLIDVDAQANLTMSFGYGRPDGFSIRQYIN